MDRQRRRRGAAGAEPRERSAALLRFADALEARFADLVDLNVLEVGSVRSWAEFLQVGPGGGPARAARRRGARVRLQRPHDAEPDEARAGIQAGRDEGAQIAYGGGRPAGLDRGFYVEPTLFVDVDNSMTIAQKEFFGPVGVVIPFRDEQEAIRLANASEYGLAAGVWSADPVRAYKIATRIRAGLVYINGGGAGSSPHTPFGGYKASGLGVERGEYGLEEFLLAKSVIWSAR